MSGPTPLAPVLARIGEIQGQLGTRGVGAAAVVTSPGSAGVPSASSAFASALADAVGSGDPATSGTLASLPASWSIPWAPGMAPAMPAQSRAASGSRQALLNGSATSGVAGGDAVWPVRGTITQGFGPTTCTLEPSATVNGHRYAHYHDGLDIGAAQGTPVQSMAAGAVEFAGRYPDGAMVVRVRHADGSVALYAHLQPSLGVKAGDTVTAGEALGRVGMTGHTTGPHLHLELTVNGHNVDPMPVLQSGRLPGSPASANATPAGTASAAPSSLAAASGTLTPAALGRFDAVASSIPYHAEIRDAAVRAGIDPLLLASLVKAESGFHAKAVSSVGALGLCQLMPATAKSLGVKDPFDPIQNLRGGARYFANNLRIYGRADLALAAYHDGKGAVAAAGGIPDYPVTHRYIDRILSDWQHYQEAAA